MEQSTMIKGQPRLGYNNGGLNMIWWALGAIIQSLEPQPMTLGSIVSLSWDKIHCYIKQTGRGPLLNSSIGTIFEAKIEYISATMQHKF